MSNKNKSTIKSKIPTIKQVTLQYLIDVGEKKIKVSDNFNIERLNNALPSIKKLNNIIGMTNAKSQVAKIILLYTSGLCNKNNDMMHTMIQGSSGTGKTKLARIIGEIYWKLDVLSTNIDNHNTECDDNTDDKSCKHLRKKSKIDYEYNKKDSNTYDYDDEFMSHDESDSSFCTNSDNSETANNKTYKFIETSRTDFIDRYQGGTALKVTNLVKSAIGGVIFIDEAYSLGNTGTEDSYNKEAIDTIVSLMEKYKSQVVFILAGYRGSLENNLIRYNEGFARRITFIINLDSYTSSELAHILIHTIENIDPDDPWIVTASHTLINKFFETNYLAFPRYAGDIETMLFHIKMNHSARLLHSSASEKKRVIMNDIVSGFNDFHSYRNNL
jgi:DNA polymerase III delta prime subunit